MNNREAKSKVAQGQHGFSLIELMVVLTIIFIVSAIAVTMLTPNLQQARVDAEMREVLDTFRQAREFSIANRRYVQISFPANNQIQVTQMDNLTPGAGGVNPVLTTLTLAPPLVFNLVGMPDTPDAYGNANAIEIAGINGGPPAGMYFQSDGQFVAAATYLPINGTVFMGYPGQQSTARAVTILGTTGRVRGWKSAGNTTWYQF
ncbi:MAG: prepilin-type N-terminal cleavage/methylation domain-containing protein [Candidatus Acidiferrales bacterium]